MKNEVSVHEGNMRQLAVLSVWWLATLTVCAQTSDDKVVIADATDSYVFIMKESGVSSEEVTVKNHQETTYELVGNESQAIHPHIFYGDFLTLDKASCGREKANHSSFTRDGLFHDGTKVCVFEDMLTKKHPRQTARFQRTFSDARRLARVSLQDEYFIRHKTVTVTIPQELSAVRITPFNLPEQITMKADKTGTDSVFTFTITDMPGWKEEPGSPPENLVSPFFLITGLFKDYTDLYRWEQELGSKEVKEVKELDALIGKMTVDCTTDQERIANTFQWVQQNIRYVAYEAGMAGFQPDRPAEVLRKRYGDCKGMALLLKTLLRAQGFDARMVTVGTMRLPYNISDYPSLASADHVVCAVLQQGQPLFLDATFHHIPAGYVPQQIQGRQAMMEDGDDCLLLTIPVMPANASVDSLNYEYRLDADRGCLYGRVECSLSGEMKEYFMNIYERLQQSSKEELLAGILNDDDRSNKITEAAWADSDSRHERAVITGKADNGHAVIAAGSKLYVELNPHNTYTLRVDTAHRQNDYFMPTLFNIVREVRLEVPQGYEVEHLPDDFLLTTANGMLACSFKQHGPHIVFCQRVTLTRQLVPRKEIPEWYHAVNLWTDACNEQVILKRLESS